MMKTIGQILSEVAHRHPRMVLTDGKKEWTVEHLLAQARADKNAPGRAGKEASDPIYFWGYSADGSISIAKSDQEWGGTFGVLVSVKRFPGRPSKLPSSGVFTI